MADDDRALAADTRDRLFAQAKKEQIVIAAARLVNPSCLRGDDLEADWWLRACRRSLDASARSSGYAYPLHALLSRSPSLPRADRTSHRSVLSPRTRTPG
ncbi:hypothetical protein [Streptomyces sp. NPDC057838]|uniref:hypothetical protein n=1 Tax=unclassified Streptomyces TaxID=2593676 RepID=UPI00369284B8